MKKGQWRMLMTELLETRNEASAREAYLLNRIEDLRVALKEMQVALDRIERAVAPDKEPEPDKEPTPRPGDIDRDSTQIMADPFPWLGQLRKVSTGPGETLHTYCLNDDGTARECEE